MPGPLSQQIDRVTTGFINTVNDALPGQSVSSGTGAARYTGQLGSRLALGPDDIRSSPAGTLFGGVYQYVQLAAGSTAIVAGMLLWWDLSVAENLYRVTAVEPTAGGCFAGIALNVITPGNFGFIQTDGRATVKFRATVAGTKAIGAVVIMALAGAGVDNALADTATDATSVSATILKKVIGQAETAPADATSSVIRLWKRDWHI